MKINSEKLEELRNIEADCHELIKKDSLNVVAFSVLARIHLFIDRFDLAERDVAHARMLAATVLNPDTKNSERYVNRLDAIGTMIEEARQQKLNEERVAQSAPKTELFQQLHIERRTALDYGRYLSQLNVFSWHNLHFHYCNTSDESLPVALDVAVNYQDAFEMAFRTNENKEGGRIKPIVLIGDSFIESVSWLFHTGYMSPSLMLCMRFIGATAIGLNNENSGSGAGNRIRETLNSIDGTPAIICMFGYVDAWAIILYHARKHGLSVRESLHKSITEYGRFMDWLLQNGYTRTAILAPMTDPACNSDAFEAEHGMKLPAEFRRMLEGEVDKRGFTYIDISHHVCDPVTGNPNPAYTVNDGNPHLYPPEVSALWMSLLGDFLESI